MPGYNERPINRILCDGEGETQTITEMK